MQSELTIVCQLLRDSNYQELDKYPSNALTKHHDDDYITPLEIMASENNFEAVNYLLSRGAESYSLFMVEPRDNIPERSELIFDMATQINQEVFFHSLNGNAHHVELLLSNGASINWAVFSAASGGHTELVESLLIRGASVGAAAGGAYLTGHINLEFLCYLSNDAYRVACARRAGLEKYIDFSRKAHMLITEQDLTFEQAKRNLEIDSSTYEEKKVGTINFIKACIIGDVKQVDSFLKQGIDPSKLGNFALNSAIRHGQIEIVKRLLQDPRVDPSVGDNEAILMAARYNQVEILKRLLEDPRVDPRVRDNEPIRIAAYHNRVEMLEALLLNERINPAARNNEAILMAVIHGDVDIVQRLLEDERIRDNSFNQLNIVNCLKNIPDEKITVAISSAIEKGHSDVVQLLLAHGHAIDNMAYIDWIRTATIFNQVEIVELLLNTIPAIAVESNHVDVVQELLKCEQFNNSTIMPGYVLLLAASFGKVEIINLLFEYRESIPDNEIEMAIECSVNSDHLDVYRLLVSWAKLNHEANDQVNSGIRQFGLFGQREQTETGTNRPEKCDIKSKIGFVA